MIDFYEQEYKYKADNISLVDFKKLMKTLPIVRKLETSSWDYYFVTDSDKNNFIRFRDSHDPELTQKRKINESNNWNRLEVDLALDPKKTNKETVSKFLELLGYKENFRIFKTAWIYWLDKTHYVMYTVFDENMKEIGRYIEVEVNKGSSGDQTHLDEAAEKLKELGLTPANRMKKSIFELYAKN